MSGPWGENVAGERLVSSSQENMEAAGRDLPECRAKDSSGLTALPIAWGQTSVPRL
jgi:hypothetical protein